MKSLFRNLKLILPCLAAVVLLVLMIVPQTGWLVRAQIAMTFWSAHALDRDQYLKNRDGNEITNAVNERMLANAAKRLPGDLQIQIAGALYERMAGDSEEINHSRVDADIYYHNLLLLRPRFPNSASLDASLIRYACNNEIKTCRDDWKKLDPELPPKAVEQKGLPALRLRLKKQVQAAPPRLKKTVTKVYSEEFDSIATEGERMEPQNAYFPMMRVALAFDTYHDNLALAELHKAALSRFWNDHADDENVGQKRLRELAFGDRSALGRSTEHTELSEQSPIVLLTFTATLLAMQSEMHGQFARGIAIRHDLLSTLSLLRSSEAKNISLTSTALEMSQIAFQRPDGQPYQDYRHPAWVTNPELLDSQENFRRYRVFLQQQHFPQEVRWLHADEAALEETLSVIDSTIPLIYHDYRDLDWLKLLWGVGLLLFSNTIWLILFGGIALLISQLPHFRERNPMSFGVGWGLLLFAAVWGSIYALIVLKFVYDPDTSQEIATLARILLAIAILLVLAIRQRWSKLRDSLWTLLAISSFIALFFWQSRFFREYLDVIDPEWIGGSAFDGPSEQECLRAVLVTILPLLFCLILAVAALVRRIPISVGIVYGLKRFALSCAGFLLLIYCGVAIETAHLEKIVADRDAAIQRVGEGQYYAAKMGQKWPG